MMKDKDVYREEFFKKYPKLEAIGTELFNTKLWILLTLHEKPHTQTEISGMRCKSLRDECPEFSYLMNALSHLEKKSFVTKKSFGGGVTWRLMDIAAFEIRKFKDDAEIQANQKDQYLLEFLKNCSNDDVVIERNFVKSGNRWKNFFPYLLKESAKSTIQIMFGLVFGV